MRSRCISLGLINGKSTVLYLKTLKSINKCVFKCILVFNNPVENSVESVENYVSYVSLKVSYILLNPLSPDTYVLLNPLSPCDLSPHSTIRTPTLSRPPKSEIPHILSNPIRPSDKYPHTY